MPPLTPAETHQATYAFATIGINAVAGHIFFVARKSPGFAAKQHWGADPSIDDLPALRSQSHIAWGFWNRLHHPQNIQNLHAFWSLSITNRDTDALINRAHLTYSPHEGTPSPGRTLLWPGVSFPIESLEGQAILGE